jgi:hypothetical protein
MTHRPIRFSQLGRDKTTNTKICCLSFSKLNHQPESSLLRLIASSQLTCLFNDYLIFKHSISLVRFFFFISCFARGARCFVLLFGVCVFQSTRVDRWKWTERRRYATHIQHASNFHPPFLFPFFYPFNVYYFKKIQFFFVFLRHEYRRIRNRNTDAREEERKKLKKKTSFFFFVIHNRNQERIGVCVCVRFRNRIISTKEKQQQWEATERERERKEMSRELCWWSRIHYITSKKLTAVCECACALTFHHALVLFWL